MRKAYKFGIAFAVVVVALVAAAAGGYAWLFYSESGLAWLSTRAVGFAGEGLTLDGVSGTLAGGARVGMVRFVGEDIEVRATDAYLELAPRSVLRLHPRITGLSARELAVVTKPGEPRGKPPDTLELPANFALVDAYIGRLVLDLGEGPLDLTNVRLDYSGGKTRHHVEDLSFTVLEHAVALRGAIDARPPFALKGAVSAVRSAAPEATVYANVSGNLSALEIDGGARSAGARASFTARLDPYAEPPLLAATVRARNLDLQAILKDLPRTDMNVALEVSREGKLLTGPIRVDNALPGPYDQNRIPLAALDARLATDLSKLTFTTLSADLGQGGAITGKGEVTPQAATLTLELRRLNLKALYSRLTATDLAGSAHMVLEEKQQTVKADLEQDGMNLALTAERAGNEIDIPRFRARARGGEASGKAHLTLAGERPFALDAALTRFDPAAWGDFPAGSINGTLAAKGTVSGPVADVRFAIDRSRWLGAPLAARGSATVSGERVRGVDVDATLGGNRFSASGALGAAGDTLDVRFNAPRLALVDPKLQGTLRGNAQISGSYRAPRIRFDVNGSALAHEAYGRVQALEARGTLTTQATGPFEVAARLRGVSTRELRLESAALDVEGTRGAHRARAQARGERLDLTVVAQGGWKEATGWSGTVRELVNRGELPVELVAPVALAVGPGRVKVEPMRLRVIGGELAVSRLDYEKGRLTTAGRFSNLPLQPVLALAGQPSDMSGTLRLAGNWSITNQPRLAGSVTITRESGDVAIGSPKAPLRVGLETLALNANFTPRGVEFDARVRSALASANGQGLIAPVGAGDAASFGPASPLRFNAEVEIARLAPFAAFIDTAMLVQGEARATLRGEGTVGDPQITGKVSADRLALALPSEGIQLTDGTLRAVLTERQIRLESFTIRGGGGVLTAQGTLARIGFDQASVDWQAKQFQVLSRPDRRLTVTGKGNAALKDGKVSLTGSLRANEGLFDIGGPRALPTLARDVVIVGKEEPKKKPREEGPRLDNIALDLRIDLGNQVLVRGQGLQVWLSGDMRVYTNARGDILASGTVNARNGTFVAYGQRLEIDRGSFYFNGPPSDPALDIVAMRKRQAVEAGVAVSGTLKNPLVRVVSDPPLPEGEALSWLILGRGPDTASAGEISALPLATSALLGKATTPLAKALGFDELGFRGGAGGEVTDQFLTLGRRISDRLYLYFEQGLGSAESLLRLEYTLTRRIVVRAQAGEASSLGLFYRYRWD